MKLELRGVTKRFGSIVANDHIDLTVEPGQIHALLGENGAGKTTLMNVLYGLTEAEEGQILIDGKRVEFRSPKEAINAGIGMVHQHFMLVPVFTVAENVTLGVEQTRWLGLLDRRRTRRQVLELSHRYGLDVDPDAYIGQTHVTPPERAALAELQKLGLRDVVRERWPNERVFTYWDYRAGMFHQDLGMRIDLVLAAEPVADRVRAAWVDRQARKGKAPSDHAPVIVDFDEAPDGDIGPVVPPPSAPVTQRGARKLPQAP